MTDPNAPVNPGPGGALGQDAHNRAIGRAFDPLESWRAITSAVLVDEAEARSMVDDYLRTENQSIDRQNAVTRAVTCAIASLSLLGAGWLAFSGLLGSWAWPAAGLFLGLGAALCYAVSSRYVSHYRRPGANVARGRLQLDPAMPSTVRELRLIAAAVPELRPIVARWILSGIPIRTRELSLVRQYLTETQTSRELAALAAGTSYTEHSLSLF